MAGSASVKNSASLPTSRKQALSEGLKFYFSGQTCANGHAGERYARSGACVPCNVARSEKWQLANHDRVRAYNQRPSSLSRDPTYSSWKAMVARCHYAGAGNWKRYGAVGVSVCGRWRRSFVDFLKDMGSRPSLQHTLDRFPNGKGNYEPGNCRWATQLEQHNNKSSNRIVDYQGRRMTLSEARRASGIFISKSTVRDRLSRGWPIEMALETAPKTVSERWR